LLSSNIYSSALLCSPLFQEKKITRVKRATERNLNIVSLLDKGEKRKALASVPYDIY